MHMTDPGLNRSHNRAAPQDLKGSDGGKWGRRLLVLILTVWAGGYAWGFHADPYAGFKLSLIILTLAGFLLAVRGLRDPVPGILGVGMLCTLDTVSRVYLFTGGLWRWNTFNYFLLLVILSSLSYCLRLRDVHTHWLLWCVAWMAVGWVISPDKKTGAHNVAGVLAYFGLLRYWSAVADREDVWYWTGILNACIAALGGLFYYQQMRHLPYINPNAWCFWPLTAMFSSVLSLHHVRDRRRQIPLALLSLISLAWVYLSGSRGGTLLALISAVAILLQMQGVSSKWLVVGGLSLVCVVLFTYFTDQYSYMFQRLQKTLDPNRPWFERTSGRTDMLLGAWYIFLQQPLGVGTGGFAPSFSDVTTLATYEGGYWGTAVSKAAHAAWAKVVAENGLPGIIVFSGFVLSFAWSGWKKRRDGCWIVGIFTFVLFALAFFWTEFAAKGVWWLASGAVATLHPESWRSPR